LTTTPRRIERHPTTRTAAAARRPRPWTFSSRPPSGQGLRPPRALSVSREATLRDAPNACSDRFGRDARPARVVPPLSIAAAPPLIDLWTT
jgi:hypothetical protein